MEYRNKQISRIPGILIICGIIVGLLSIIPSLEGENYLKEVYPNRNRILVGAVFQFLLVPIYIGFALVFYSIIKDFNKPFSVGFVGFRFMAGAFQLIGTILLPVFILLSQTYLTATPSNIAILELSGNILRLLRDLTNHLGVILATGLGNLLFYQILYKEKLVPKWLSLWGFLGNLLIMTASFLLLFQLVEVVSPEYGIMSIPLVLQEIILAIWLMVRGLNLPETC